MAKQYIKDFHGRIIGSLEELSNGDIIVKDFHGRLKGKYRKADNTTRDFYGRVIARGNQVGMLITSDR